MFLIRVVGDYVEGIFVIEYHDGVQPTWRAVWLEGVEGPLGHVIPPTSRRATGRKSDYVPCMWSLTG